MAALDGLDFAKYAIGMQEKGRERFRAEQERNALSRFMPKIYGSSQAQRAQMVPEIAQESPEALNQLLPVIQKMDDSEMQRQKAEVDGYYAAFWGVKDDADFRQRLDAAQRSGMPQELLPRSRGEAEFRVRKTLGLKQLLDAEFENRKLNQADRRMDLMESGQYGSPVTVMGPGGQPAFVQFNPKQGTARPAQLPNGYAPMPPQASQPNAPSGYRFAPDQTLEPIPGGPQDPAVKPPVMPSFAQKAEDQDVEALGTLAQGQAQLEKMFGDAQRANLGFFNNWSSYIGGFTGGGDQTQAFADLRQGLETFRNNILMLHRGVQTEGDANRAMSQIIQNINNPQIVQSNLETLSQLNKRAYELKLGAVNLRRERNRLPPFDPASADLPPSIPARGRSVQPPRPQPRPSPAPARQPLPNRAPAPARPQAPASPPPPPGFRIVN